MNQAVRNNGDRSTLPARSTSAVFTIITIFIICGVAFPQPPAYPAVEFFKEEITMTINDGEFTISGAYYFRNNTDINRPMPIVFPFHIDDSTHYPYRIRVFFINNDRELELGYEENRDRGFIRIAIPMIPKSISEWRLEYTQRIDKPEARYILRSTQAWGEPLEEALYKIDIPNDIDVDYIWADVDSVTASKNREILWIHKTEYMPFNDMTVRWKDK